ncbi:MAG: hypothetical protein CFE21_02885 [Bacteroidetes bacterium B1(2017)]|nr:MAG: hypothetical protein CFE21_02885 [Bacteroidetes bacterium B1(2017)]
MKTTLQKLVILFLLALSIQAKGQSISTFEDISLAPNSIYNGFDFKGGFKSGSAFFTNMYDTTFGAYWEGFAVSNTKDDSTAGYSNQYSAITGSGMISTNYGVFYAGGKIILDKSISSQAISGFHITNSTYAYFDMKTGSQFSKKFGGTSGNDPDYLRVVINAWKDGKLADSTFKFYLADYRNSDNSKDYILKTWQWVDLKSFGAVDSFAFSMESSDTGSFGINTPRYFCLDNFNLASTAIAKQSEKVLFNAYPNPATNTLTIESYEAIEEVKILDINGREIGRSKETTLAVDALTPGVYLVEVKSLNGIGVQKFIKN